MKIYEAQISDYICSTHHFKIYEGDLYVRNGCQDIKVDKYEFYNWIYQLAAQNGVTLMSSNCADILKEVMLRSLKFKGIPNGEEYTVFRNCCVSNLTGQIVSLPDDYFSTICVEANYVTDPVLNHPVADQFLYTISGGDPVLTKLHWTYWGYCLSSDAHAKALFFLYGPSGNNGKSTELNLQKSLLSKGSVDFMPIRTLLSEFGKARLRNIRMEISADEGELNLSARDIGYLKTFSGHDDLTGLYNRSKAINEINQILLSNEMTCGALLMLDMNDFKEINDNYGHAIGDKIITKTAKRLKEMFRNDDILCRLGGDEFMILCRNIDEISIRMKLEDVTRQMKIPYLIEEYQIMAPLSIGFVMIPLYGTTFNNLYKKADIALYKAKQDGLASYRMYHDDMNKKAL